MKRAKLLPERATCDRCFLEIPLTRAERSVRVGAAGEFVCDSCKVRPLRVRMIRLEPPHR